MRILLTFMCVLALGLMGCSETTGVGGTGGIGGDGGTPTAGCDRGLCEGIDCDDNDFCTDDFCSGADGTCSYVARCDDLNDCTTETCDSGNESCSTPTSVADGTSCAGGTCQSGVCVLSGTVLPCTEQGIRNAIAAGDDTYTFDCDGTAPVLTQGEIVIDNDVILDGEGKLTVDGSCGHVLFSVPEGVTAELRGFAVTKGYGSEGGGIRNDGTLTVADSTVTRCSTAPSLFGGGGGGIANGINATLTVSNSTVSDNAADFSGGGIWNHGMLTLTDSIVSGNSAAGIWNWESFTVTNSTVSGNAGGGITNRRTGTITRSTVSGNRGDGIHSAGKQPLDDPASLLTIAHSTISGNTGHGISNYSGTLMLTNATVSGSISAGSGGDEISSVVAHGTLIDGACTTVEGGVAVAAWTSLGYNVESPGNSCDFDEKGDQVNVTPEELALEPLEDNGGPTRTHALGQGSFAIDVIPLHACFDIGGDQRGEPRDDGTCDVGAFEVQQ